MQRATPRDSLHSIWLFAELVCVECSACHKRSVLGPDKLPTPLRGNMTTLHDLPLRCGCGADKPDLYIPTNAVEAERWRSRAL
jgi:hypothetical protein